MGTQQPQTGFLRQRIPAWLGSLLFHLAVLLILLLFFNYRTELNTAPGERIALGGIALEPYHGEGTGEGDAAEENSPNEANTPPAAPTLETILDGKLSDADVGSQLPDSVIGPQALPGTGQRVAGASQSGNLGGGSPFPGNGIGSGGKTVNVFGTNGKGSTFVFVFDRSGSMSELNERPIRAAKTELARAIDQLENLHRFNIIFYNEKPQVWQPGRKMFEATDSNKENAKKFVGSITPSGGTRHFEPLLEAVRLKPDVIFFLTDGEETDALSNGQLAELEKKNGGLSQINVIQFGLGEDKASAFLRRLAASNRGEYIYYNLIKETK